MKYFIIYSFFYFYTHTAFCQEHPFLIVKENMYTELRQRSEKEPWKTMKQESIRYVNNNVYRVTDPAREKHYKIRRIALTGALAYILDHQNKSNYVNRVRSALFQITDAMDSIIDDPNSGPWDKSVPPGSTIFSAIIVLDILYNELNENDRQTIESIIGYNVSRISGGWGLNNNAVNALWGLYRNNLSAFNSSLRRYKDSLMSELTDSGVYVAGPGYAWARLGSSVDRGPAKANFMDVCSFTGYEDFYSNETIIGFYEWLYTVGTNPFYFATTFGDTGPVSHEYLRTSRTLSLHRFSITASRYSAWKFKNIATSTLWQMDDILFTYILMDQSLPTPKQPESKIWYDGSAAFWEKGTSKDSLMGVLWNTPKAQWHSHKDVNSINIAAYGENVIRNSGYLGASKGINSTFGWNWINNNAKSNNVVVINDKDHETKIGAGITEGFVGKLLDYASSDSGDALGNGHHQRNFIMVHPQDNKSGYFILLDEVRASIATDQFDVLHHPESANYNTVSENREFQWLVNLNSEKNVYLNIFLATPPSSSTIRDGGLANWDWGNGSFIGKYLSARYNTNSSGMGQALTILFPSNQSNPKGNMTRVGTSDYTGAKIELGNGIVDFIIESNGSKEITIGNVNFKGQSSAYRLTDTNNSFYFLKKGTNFSYQLEPKKGFISGNKVTLYLREKDGNIISEGADVTFFYPSIKGVRLNGNKLQVSSQTQNSSTVFIPKGTHDLTLETEIETDPIPTGWVNQAITNQNEAFIAEAQIIPKGSNINAVIGFSKGNAAKWADLAVIIRFNPEGIIDVRNANTYDVLNKITYSTGKKYFFRIYVNVLTNKYSVVVTLENQSQITLGEGYSFRTEQLGTTSLDNFANYAQEGSIEVSKFKIYPSIDKPKNIKLAD